MRFISLHPNPFSINYIWRNRRLLWTRQCMFVTLSSLFFPSFFLLPSLGYLSFFLTGMSRQSVETETDVICARSERLWLAGTVPERRRCFFPSVTLSVGCVKPQLIVSWKAETQQGDKMLSGLDEFMCASHTRCSTKMSSLCFLTECIWLILFDGYFTWTRITLEIL